MQRPGQIGVVGGQQVIMVRTLHSLKIFLFIVIIYFQGGNAMYVQQQPQQIMMMNRTQMMPGQVIVQRPVVNKIHS